MSKKSTKVQAEENDAQGDGQAGEAATDPQAAGSRLLKAVERIVESPEKIEAQAEAIVQAVREELPDDADGAEVLALAERKLIARYSNRAALAGGASSLPALIPGVGTLASIVGGGLVDMTCCLKFEVEMVLALSSLHGFDIRDPRERQLAYLLAASHTYASTPGSVPLADFLKLELDAIWHYTPRQLGKLVTTLFVKLAIVYSGKGLIRAVPLVGVLVSGGFNKALTHRLGGSVVELFAARPRARHEGAEDKQDQQSKPPRAGKKPRGKAAPAA